MQYLSLSGVILKSNPCEISLDALFVTSSMALSILEACFKYCLRITRL